VARHSVGEHVDGRYRICALLGEGDIAEVYRALEATTGGDVVLKVPRASIGGDLAALNRYRTGIDIAARLHHPGLRRLLSEPKAPYKVFEYVDGVSLRTRLKTHGPLPADDAARQVGMQRQVNRPAPQDRFRFSRVASAPER
jgi:serine/threonine-protein kinase